MQFSGLTNERVGMEYIPNAEIEAEDCTNCSATWRRCLQGWPESNRHPMGVCCSTCHNTDTHNADAARRRAQEQLDTADASAVTEVKPLKEYLPDAIGRITTSTGRLRDDHESAAVELLMRSPAPRTLAIAIAELEWLNWRADGQRADLNKLMSDATAAEQKLQIADRQRREFRQAAERASTVARERALRTASTDVLLEELRRRLNTKE